MVLLAMLPLGLFGQSPAAVDISVLPTQIVTPQGDFRSGDLVQVDFYLGTAEQPVKDLVGFELKLELEGLARPASSFPAMGFEGSCLVEDAAIDTDSEWDALTETYVLKAQLGSDRSVTGTGRIVSLWLEITADHADGPMIGARAGGLALIENISGKRAPEPTSTASETQVFPIPAATELFIAHQGDESSSARILSLDGRLLSEIALPPSSKVSLDVQGLPAGIALLVFEDGSHRRISIRN